MYLGGLGVALIALLGMLALSLIPERLAEPSPSELVPARAQDAPETSPITAELAAEDDAASSEDPQALVAASDRPQPGARRPRAKRAKSKRERSAPASSQPSHAILDPWK